MNKLSLIMAMNIALLTSACSDNSTDVSPQPQEKSAIKQEATDTLAYLAKDCETVNVSGAPASFHSSNIPTDTSFTSSEVCGYADLMADDYYRLSRNSMEVFCDMADKFVNEIGGGNYSVTKEKFKQMYEPAKAKPYLNILNSCESKANRLQLIKDTSLTVGIYSVGTVQVQGNSCKAYLAQAGTQPGGVQIRYYRLMGTGQCKNIDTDKISTEHFHPDDRPNSITLGNLIKKRYKYNGEYPNTWIFKGKEFPFN